MFFESDRIGHMRAMILADNEKDRRAALKNLLPFQRKDFEGIFKAMAGLPVTIRLLDPPLHEFLHTKPTPKRNWLLISARSLPTSRLVPKRCMSTTRCLVTVVAA